MIFGPLWLWMMVPGLIIGFYAQIKLSSAYRKYSRVGAASGLSGAEAAREILDQAGLSDVPVKQVGGHLTDHYDPTKRALFLSTENFQGRSLAAVGVAAHETGHALQHQAAYAPLHLRMAIVPITQFATFAWSGIFLVGWIFHMFSQLAWIAVAVFSVLALFQLVTLPVEFDASRRAKAQLIRLGIVQDQEATAVSRVLNAAALTYVAAMVSAVLELVYWLMIARNRN